MRHRFLLAAAFLIVFWAGDRALSILGRHAAHHSSMPLAELYSGRGGGDAVILGNSRAMRHFDAAALSQATGLQFRNYALLGASTEFMRVLLADYLMRYGAPRLVILEISCLSAAPGAEVAQRLYRWDSAELDKLLHAADPALYYGGRLSNLLDLNSDVFLNTLHKTVAPHPSVLLNGSLDESAAESLSRQMPVPYFTIRERNAKALQDIAHLAREHGFSLLLILTPVLPQYRQRLPEIADFVAAASAATQSPVLDLTALPLSAEQFADPVHINESGVNVVQSTLRAALEAHPALFAQRGH